MPQVVRGLGTDPEGFDFMQDRHFWITVFMFARPHPPRLLLP